jgi:HEAT repeat protein
MIDYSTDLKSPNPDRIIFTLYTLLHEKNKAKYLDRLIELTENHNEKIRIATVMVLEKIKNNKLIPLLEKLLEDKIYKIRIIAAISLANYQNEKAIPVLESVIKNDINDHSLHKRTIEALSKYKNEGFLDIFEQMLSHRRKVSRIKSIDALIKLGTPTAKKILKKAEAFEIEEEIKLRFRNALRKFENLE